MNALITELRLKKRKTDIHKDHKENDIGIKYQILKLYRII